MCLYSVFTLSVYLEIKSNQLCEWITKRVTEISDSLKSRKYKKKSVGKLFCCDFLLLKTFVFLMLCAILFCCKVDFIPFFFFIIFMDCCFFLLFKHLKWHELSLINLGMSRTMTEICRVMNLKFEIKWWDMMWKAFTLIFLVVLGR